MTLVTLLRDLHHRDVRLTVDGAKLRVDAPRGVLTPELRETLKKNKPALIEWARQIREEVIVLDFETRAVADLEKVGARAYITHPTFEVVCLVAVRGRTTITWSPGQPPPITLFEAADVGIPFVAHNAAKFDKLVWESQGWPAAFWIDTVPLARLAGLPGKLDMIAWDLFERRKDVEGRTLTLALSRPDRDGRLPEINAETLTRVMGYCRTDVELLGDVWWQRLRQIRDVEAHVRALDDEINERGFCFDVALATAVIECEARVIDEHRSVAPVSPQTLASHAQLKSWLASRGVIVDDVRSETLGLLLSESEISEEVRRTLEARLSAAGITGHKLRAALRRVSPDGRLRDTLNYYGAHTGRWSGRGFQPQNLPRVADKLDIHAAISAALARDVNRLRELAADAGVTVDDALASLVRPCVRAPVGRVLVAVDYSSIEARALLWLAGDEDGLEPFRKGRDAYKLMAASLLQEDVTAIDKVQRQLGKALVLGCGYGVGAETFRERASEDGVDWSTIGVTPSDAVEAWRDAHALVAGFRAGVRRDGGPMRRGGMWRDLERAAMRACAGEHVEVARTMWERSGDDVVCVLPGGRRLVYRGARIENAPTPWGEMRPTFTFTRDNRPERSYGGKLTENITQAVCRDLLVDALVRLDRAGFDIVLHVHDEIVVEVPSTDAANRLEAMKTIMREPPAWARGLPIAVDGYSDERYRK
jgi:DNA polymerase